MSEQRAGPLPAKRLRLPFRGSLSLRLASLLSIALLPLGLIAVWQTTRLERELDEIHSLTTTAITARAASNDRRTIEAAFGAAKGLAAAIPEMRGDPAQCRETFQRFLDRSGGDFAFAGFIDREGHSVCSSADTSLDLSDDPEYRALMSGDRRKILVLPEGPVSGASVILAGQPVRDRDGAVTGFVAVSIPHLRLDPPPDDQIAGRKMDLVTINRSGEILTATGDLGQAEGWLPADRDAAALVYGPDRFIGQNRNGETRAFSVVPIVEETVYAVGSWLPRSAGEGRAWVSPALFPILMWLASLALVFMAVERLVVRHVRRLAAQMQVFGRDRNLPPAGSAESMPSELAAIDDAFGELAARLLRDEADLLDAMHDKDVLLKEVHHRVKNNLQLISSIINMQIRATQSDETLAALQNVNRRVAGMATVHRRLYQAENLGLVQAGDLLRDVVAPLLDLAPPGGARPEVELKLDPVVLYPDQAVPVALLTVEAVTNALKYLQTDANGERWLRVCLDDLGEGTVRISTASSLSERPATGESQEAVDAGGLGSRLIAAFARQLDSSVEIEEGQGVFRLSVTFEALPFSSDDPA
ncbi:hypothetical protein CLV78_105181 [Aliiruegeria haliotis]|uniref:histidine kinase n=1 Tax=Aliiruegeria haliotis TaxID=1280846 RepID=A0A2T0RPL8_9RHOB|nr:sensor histidine kinase [Aliiruegeria haliotis]PRY23129.1 hypothetical protein CLV78_105181 [Aliiruegeria haliotis]